MLNVTRSNGKPNFSSETGVAPLEYVIVTLDAWLLLQSRCREMEDGDIKIGRVGKTYIEFSLLGTGGRADYRIRAEPLKRTNAIAVSKVAGRKLYVLFLIFHTADGQEVVDSGKTWWTPFALYLKYFANKGPRPSFGKRSGLMTKPQKVDASDVVKKFLARKNK